MKQAWLFPACSLPGCGNSYSSASPAFTSSTHRNRSRRPALRAASSRTSMTLPMPVCPRGTATTARGSARRVEIVRKMSLWLSSKYYPKLSWAILPPQTDRFFISAPVSIESVVERLVFPGCVRTVPSTDPIRRARWFHVFCVEVLSSCIIPARSMVVA